MILCAVCLALGVDPIRTVLYLYLRLIGCLVRLTSLAYMSFLSRFELQMAGGFIEIRTRRPKLRNPPTP